MSSKKNWIEVLFQYRAIFFIGWTFAMLVNLFALLYEIVLFTESEFQFDLLENTWQQRILYSVILLLILLSTAVGYWRLVFQEHKNSLEKTLCWNLEQERRYYLLLQQKTEAIQAETNQFEQQIKTISQMVQQGIPKEITAYMNQITLTENHAELQKLTGHKTLDILFSEKMQYAKCRSIQLQLDYQPGVQISHIAAPDLCILLGNLLDNALAAAKQSTQKQITCTIQQKNSYYIVIHVINSCDTQPVMKDGIPQRKTPSEQHGYGVQNVLNCAKKYGGHCQFTYCAAQQQFQTTVLLPCTELD